MKEKTASARQQILDTAASMFYRDGYRAVGIDTIVEKSGVAKMTLYRHFPSKDDLIVAFLEDSNRRFWLWFETALARFPGLPLRQLYGLFEALAELARDPVCLGCAFQNTAAEFPDPTHPGHRVALAHKEAVIERLQDMAEAAGANEPEVLANQLLLLMDGAFVAARMFGRDNHAKYVAEAAAALIDAQF